MPIILNGDTGITTPGLTNSGADSAASQTLSGNLTFTGTGNRITGDFSNATLANRVWFRDATTNNSSTIGVLPNGTSAVTSVIAFGGSDPDNAPRIQMRIDGTSQAQLRSEKSGTGTVLPMTFIIDSAERVRIDTSGNIGIGTTAPFSRVHIADSISTGTITLGGAPTTGYYSQIFQNGPLNSLDIISNGDQAYRASLGTNNGTGIIRFFTAGFTTGNTERMRIDSSGNVGIGTSSPLTRLHVVGASNTGSGVLVSNGGTNVAVLANEATWLGTGTSNNAVVSSFGATSLLLGTNGAERMRINSSGLITTNIEGSATLYPSYSARAWVNFNGTGTVAIRGSGNVTSITDGGAGNYSVNFTTAMPDANYNAVTAISHAGGVTRSVSGTIEGYSTASVTVNTGYSSTLYDPTNVNVSIFR